MKRQQMEAEMSALHEQMTTLRVARQADREQAELEIAAAKDEVMIAKMAAMK